jgi:RND family efflux transporter MFP subunit
MKKIVKFGLFGLLFLAALGGYIYYTRMPVALMLTEVRPQLAELSFIEQGKVIAENTVLVFPEMQGKLAELCVEEDQEVKAGDVLATIDDTALRLGIEQVNSKINSIQSLIANLEDEQNRNIEELQASRNVLLGELHAINAQAENAKIVAENTNDTIRKRLQLQQVKINQNQSDVDRARADLERIEALCQTGTLPLTDLEAAQASLSQAETLLEVSQCEIAVIATEVGLSNEEYYKGKREALNAQIRGIDQQLRQDFTISMIQHYTAQIEVEEKNIAQLERSIVNSRITAPHDGTITNLYAQGSNFISPGTPVAEITVHGQMEIEVYVSTHDVTHIQIEDRVGLTLLQRGNNINFYGTVSAIGSQAVVHRTHLGVEELGVKVTITPDESPVPLGIGFELDVTFFVYREENQLTVPLTALFSEMGEARVWLIRGGNTGEVTSAAVEAGQVLRTETVVLSGLFEGDFVVSDANNQFLREGVRVRAQ